MKYAHYFGKGGQVLLIRRSKRAGEVKEKELSVGAGEREEDDE